MLPNMGKRKYPERNNPYYVDVMNTSGMFSTRKNRYRPCREIVYTEDNVPVRKLYFSVSSADVIIFSPFFFLVFRLSLLSVRLRPVYAMYDS